MSPAKTTNLSSRLPGGTSGSPLTPWTLERGQGRCQKSPEAPLWILSRTSLPCTHRGATFSPRP